MYCCVKYQSKFCVCNCWTVKGKIKINFTLKTSVLIGKLCYFHLSAPMYTCIQIKIMFAVRVCAYIKCLNIYTFRFTQEMLTFACG